MRGKPVGLETENCVKGVRGEQTANTITILRGKKKDKDIQ